MLISGAIDDSDTITGFGRSTCSGVGERSVVQGALKNSETIADRDGRFQVRIVVTGRLGESDVYE